MSQQLGAWRFDADLEGVEMPLAAAIRYLRIWSSLDWEGEDDEDFRHQRDFHHEVGAILDGYFVARRCGQPMQKVVVRETWIDWDVRVYAITPVDSLCPTSVGVGDADDPCERAMSSDMGSLATWLKGPWCTDGRISVDGDTITLTSLRREEL